MNNLNNKISVGTITRTAVLALALINQLLSAALWSSSSPPASPP